MLPLRAADSGDLPQFAGNEGAGGTRLEARRETGATGDWRELRAAAPSYARLARGYA